MYGTNAISWTRGEINRLEVIQNKIGRLALGANMGTGTEAIRGDMGWSTFEERFMKGKLSFKARIDNMQGDRWVREICLQVGYKTCWMRNCAAMARDVGMGRTWDFSRAGINQWRMAIANGDRRVLSSKELKPLIKQKVEGYGLEKWVKGIESKRTLNLYRSKKCPGREWFYNGS